MKQNTPVLFLLGPAGSFSDIAADRLKGSFRKHYVSSFRAVFKKMEKGGYGFLPVRNKILGELRVVISRLQNYEILKKIRLPVRFVLAAKKSMAISKIRFLYAPLLVKKQCMNFIKKYLPHAKKIISSDSTSNVIKKIVRLGNDRVVESAAIGSEKAAKLFGLRILHKSIQNDPRNWTEFVLFKVSSNPSKSSWFDRVRDRVRRKRARRSKS